VCPRQNHIFVSKITTILYDNSVNGDKSPFDQSSNNNNNNNSNNNNI
jgi:hypothetical protein